MTEEMVNFILENYQSMTRKEIAAHLGVTPEAVKAKISRLRKQGFLNFSKLPEIIYTDEVNSFLLSNYTKYPYNKLTELVNQRFGNKFTFRGITTQVQHLKVELNLPRKPREKKEVIKKERKIPIREKFSEEQNNWIKENFMKFHHKELTELFNDKFNTEWKVSQISYHCVVNLNLRAKPEEKECYKCAVSKPVWTEVIGEKGFIEIKLPNGKWVLKHRYLWEQYHNKKVPDKHYVIFLDGNRENFSKENLVCLSDFVQGHLSGIPTTCVNLKKCKIANVMLEQILGGIR